jgi:hypothetical protein
MIQLDIDPEVEKRIVEAAQARGLDPSAYASKVLTDAVAFTTAKHLSKSEFEDFLDAMLIDPDKAPKLPDYAYTRESFYEDHD